MKEVEQGNERKMFRKEMEERMEEVMMEEKVKKEEVILRH